MLRALSIRDFVIVDVLELEFEEGFTVFSGETGAGKSILVDALTLVLGARGESNVVREGAKRAEIAAEFDPSPASTAWLEEQALETSENLLLRRVVDVSGRSKAWINGSAVTLAQLRELAESLIDIYGQHAHQALLQRHAQRELLDAHAGLSLEVRELAALMQLWRVASDKLTRAQSDEGAIEQERERIKWQLDELERIAPKASEWQEIQLEHQRLSNASELIEGAQSAIQIISDADEAVLSRLAPLASRLSHLAQHDERLNEVLESLEPARIQLEEAARALTHYLDHLDVDPQRLAWVERRVEALHSAARKLRVAPDALPDEQQRLGAQLAALELSTDTAALTAAEQAAKARFLALAKKVSARRKQAAASLSSAVTEAMQSLSMTGGRFKVALEAAEPSASGCEQVEFQVAGHQGTELRPLAKVASGGELARISLAISVIASSAGIAPTLIFDEVDSGIGGAVAEVVGRLLRSLGSERQVLCVTHLPQVAARAEHHFSVSKVVRGDAAVSQVASLDMNARVDEVARMLGGIEITGTTRKHARELLSLSD